MDFDYSDEQRMLKDSIDRLIAPAYDDLAHRKKTQKEPCGYSEALWGKYVELGLTALPFSEEEGGFGGGPVETMIVMEAVGRGLALEPYLASAVLAGTLVRLGAEGEKREALISAIAQGVRFAFAHVERQARYDLYNVVTSARKTENGFTLEGDKSVVVHGDSAEKLIVSARTSSASQADTHGITLFVVDANAPGISRRGFATQDGQRGAAISLAGVQVGKDAVLGSIDHGAILIEKATDIAIAAVCAEAVGAMAALHALTLEYLKTRKQFGVPIGSFQVLQHKAVDMFTALEQARSMTYYAAMMAEEPDAKTRRAALSAAKVQINQSARFVGETAVQLHGGIGVTMEYRAGHYFKRLTMIESLFGDTMYHMRQVDQAGGLLEAA